METQKSKTWLWILIAVILTAIIVGGGVYYWQNKKATDAKNDLNNQITNLQNQINTLKSTNSTSTVTNPTSSSSANNASDTNTSSTANNPKIYTNTDYGFQLTFDSDLWNNYIIQKFHKEATDILPAYDDYYVYIPDSSSKVYTNYDKAGYTYPMVVSVYPVNTYNDWDVNKEGIKPILIGTNGQYAITYSHWNGGPTNQLCSDHGYSDYTACFNAFSDAFKQVANSFQITK